MLPEKRSEVRAWLERAVEDLWACEVDLAADPPIVRDALFHCQQSVEKTLKAFLTAYDVAFPKTHELDVLAGKCEQIDPSLCAVLDPARNLTFYAWAFRYPGSVDTPEVTEAHDRLALARTVYGAIVQRLPKDVVP